MKCGVALGAIAAFSCLTVAGQVTAQEPAGTRWSGVYIGASIGGGRGDASFAVPNEAPGLMDFDGLVGGLHLGWQRQWGHVVGGLETSLLFGDFGGAADCPNVSYSCSVDVERIWMIGPRLGVATDRLHFYGTGGFARGLASSKVTEYSSGNTQEHGQGSNAGWYWGGGVEFVIATHMVLGVEYRHIEFDGDRHFSPTGIQAASREVDATVDTIQARLTFKIGEIVR